MHSKIQVVVAKDQAMVLGALVALLETEPDIAVCARASNGHEALEAIGKQKPNILVTDIEMPGLTGLTLAAEVRDRYPNKRVIILTTFARPGYLRRARRRSQMLPAQGPSRRRAGRRRPPRPSRTPHHRP